MEQPLPYARVAPEAGPVTQTERIVSLDVLRGFAILGIIFINIPAFALVSAAFLTPQAYGDFSGLNFAAWLVTHLFTDQKFMPIFSMLFGAGIVLMTSRREAAGKGSASVHYRRMFVLLLIGLAHGHLIWYGDILFQYAVLGMVLYLFRHLRPRTLVLTGLVVLAVGSVLALAFQQVLSTMDLFAIPGSAFLDLVQAFRVGSLPPPERIAEELAAYRGSWREQMTMRVDDALLTETGVFATYGVWRGGGFMLMGMGLFKLDVFSARRPARFYMRLAAIGLTGGLGLVVAGVFNAIRLDWDPLYCMVGNAQFNYWGSLLVGLGYVGLIMLMCQRGWWPSVRRRLAAVGQMALTNYLLQSVICTTIFYGHGFGLFGKVERSGLFLIAIGVIAVEYMISLPWMKRFRFGPVEWLWRTLVYLKAQPIRRVPAVSNGG